jgi:hypothetical protein
VLISDCLKNVSNNIEEVDEDINVSDIAITENYGEEELLKAECSGKELNEKKECEESSKDNELPPPQPSLFKQKVPKPWPWDESIKLDPG